jgi:hypothetical protein
MIFTLVKTVHVKHGEQAMTCTLHDCGSHIYPPLPYLSYQGQLWLEDELQWSVILVHQVIMCSCSVPGSLIAFSEPQKSLSATSSVKKYAISNMRK